MSGALPHRPRLADAAMLRRHLVDGVEQIVLHDTHRGEVIELTPAQLDQLLVCDGTRDLGGILLAAARRGAYQRASAITALIAELAERGLIVDGTAPPHPVLDRPDEACAEPAERPLEPLEGYRLRCDGHGSCCTTYASIPFSPAERRRASVAVPELDDERLLRFLPLMGAEPSALGAVTMVDGACAFLADDGRCRIHARAGSAAKPRGCRMFPAQLVDDGEAVRLSVAVECACVLESLGAGEGELLAPPGALRLGDLPAGTRVATLPERVAISERRQAGRADLRAFTAAARDALGIEVDGVAAAWALASVVAAQGLDPSSAREALRAPSPPEPGDIRDLLVALAERTRSKLASVAWRSERDRARRLAPWLDRAAQLLLEPEIQREALAGPGPFARQEAFYLRAVLHGYQLGIGRLTVARGFADRAVRMLLARRCARERPPEGEPSAAHPLTAVEAMMRGHGLDGYASG